MNEEDEWFADQGWVRGGFYDDMGGMLVGTRSKYIADRLNRIAALEAELAEAKANIQIVPTAETVRDAERWRWGVENARWIRHEHEAYIAIPVSLDADLSCKPMRVAAIDKARGQDNA